MDDREVVVVPEVTILAEEWLFQGFLLYFFQCLMLFGWWSTWFWQLSERITAISFRTQCQSNSLDRFKPHSVWEYGKLTHTQHQWIDCWGYIHHTHLLSCMTIATKSSAYCWSFMLAGCMYSTARWRHSFLRWLVLLQTSSANILLVLDTIAVICGIGYQNTALRRP